MISAGPCVVLVEPQGARNIGSVCRAMLNFGFSDLRLVRPRTDHLAKEARDMAIKAAGLLDRAGVFADLADAVADCDLVLGTTRRFGKYRDDCRPAAELGRLAGSLAPSSRLALVFGREDKGLRTVELDHCHRFVTIPTTEDHPSMNLAQAVCVCLYELARPWPGRVGAPSPGRQLAESGVVEKMYQRMEKILLDAGYLNPQNPAHIMRAYRRIFGRAGLDDREVRILQGLWSRIAWLDRQRRRSS